MDWTVSKCKIAHLDVLPRVEVRLPPPGVCVPLAVEVGAHAVRGRQHVAGVEQRPCAPAVLHDQEEGHPGTGVHRTLPADDAKLQGGEGGRT